MSDPPSAENPTDALPRFLASMQMNYDKWHDGESYDLATLRALPKPQRDVAESILISRSPPDWRDIEALAQLDSERARKAVIAALQNKDPAVRRVAMQYAGDQLSNAKRERLLIKALKTAKPYGGLTEALEEAEKFHPPKVIDALLKTTLTGEGASAVHFAALLFYLHGKAKEAFDWAHRPFYLRFNTTDKTQREAAFRELCQTLGVDPNRYV
jgi:hypothetical protein